MSVFLTHFLSTPGASRLGLAVGLSFGVVAAIVLLWFAVFGMCMLVSGCPLHKLNSPKAEQTQTQTVQNPTEQTRLTGNPTA